MLTPPLFTQFCRTAFSNIKIQHRLVFENPPTADDCQKMLKIIAYKVLAPLFSNFLGEVKNCALSRHPPFFLDGKHGQEGDLA